MPLMVVLMYCCPRLMVALVFFDVQPPNTTIELLRNLSLCFRLALISPLPAPSSTMSMKMPHATANPVSVVRSLLRRAVCHISFNNSILDTYYTVSLLGHRWVVGNDNLSDVLVAVQVFQQLHDLHARL